MKSSIILVTAIFLCFSTNLSNAQNEILKVGSPMPSFHFQLEAINDIDEIEITKDSFQGRWVVVDFWSQYCTACIKSFSEINRLQRKYKEEIQFLMVGCLYKDNYSATRQIFEKARELHDLELLSVFDSSYYNTLDIKAFPFYVIFDPNGIVRAITNVISEEYLISLIHSADSLKPSINNNDLATVSTVSQTSEALYWSTIKSWNKDQTGYKLPSSLSSGNQINIDGADLKCLYYYAMTGYFDIVVSDSLKTTFYPTLVFDDCDSTQFKGDPATGRNMFSYKLDLPEKRDIKHLLEIFKEDLFRCFGYDVRIEERQMPCWNLTMIADGQHSIIPFAASDTSFIVSTPLEFQLKNTDLEYLLLMLNNTFRFSQPPFFNKTGLEGNIDILLNGYMLDFQSVRTALEANGFALQKGKRNRKVIVIRKGINSFANKNILGERFLP